MSLHVYTYVSDSAPTLKLSDLQDILATSQKFNGDNDITGVLIHTGQIFIQILEGRRDILLKLVSKIREDFRNVNLKIVFDQELNQRRFPEWSMKIFETDSVYSADSLSLSMQNQADKVYTSVEKLIARSKDIEG